VSIILTNSEPSEIGGIPYPDLKTMTTQKLIPKWFRDLQEAGQGALFLDEVTKAPPGQQAPALQLVCDRTLGGEVLPKDVCVILAWNPPDTITGGYELDPAMANRLEHYEYRPNPKNWVFGMLNDWGKDRNWSREFLELRALVCSFINSSPTSLLDFPTEESRRTGPWASPRSWENAIIKGAISAAKNRDPISSIANIVGPGEAQKFLSWKKLQDLPDVDKLIDRVGSFKFDHKADRTHAILSSALACVQANCTEKRWGECWKLVKLAVEASEEDIATVLATGLVKLKRHPALAGVKTPEAQKELRPFLETIGLL
jgi:hypothetical protein